MHRSILAYPVVGLLESVVGCSRPTGKRRWLEVVGLAESELGVGHHMTVEEREHRILVVAGLGRIHRHILEVGGRRGNRSIRRHTKAGTIAVVVVAGLERTSTVVVAEEVEAESIVVAEHRPIDRRIHCSSMECSLDQQKRELATAAVVIEGDHIQMAGTTKVHRTPLPGIGSEFWNWRRWLGHQH